MISSLVPVARALAAALVLFYSGYFALAGLASAQGSQVRADGEVRASGTAAQSCFASSTWVSLEGERPRPTNVGDVVSAMAKRDVVLLGEHHDDPDHHRWQLQVLAALHARRPDMVIGFEAFPRRVQPALDRWVAGESTVSDFLKQSDWEAVWSMPADLYLPLFQFARMNRVPMAALNVERKLTRSIADKGWDAVPESEREGVGQAASPPQAYRDALLEAFREHVVSGANGGGKREPSTASDPRFLNFVASQTTWDRAMAEALARLVAARPGGDKPLVVGIMGSGHIRDGHGVPWQLRALGVKSVGTLLPIAAEGGCKEVRVGLADAVFAIPKPAAAKPAPPRLGVRLEEKDGVVLFNDVTAGSLAERSGIRKGDVLVEVAGRAVRAVGPVIALVRGQPAGTWLPMRVKRGDEVLDVVARFPAQP